MWMQELAKMWPRSSTTQRGGVRGGEGGHELWGSGVSLGPRDITSTGPSSMELVYETYLTPKGYTREPSYMYS